MRITEAIRIIQGASQDGSPFSVILACGFTPLHVTTFLAAHLQDRLPQRRVSIVTGLYGDLAGTLERFTSEQMRTPEAEGTSLHALGVIVEWEDLDARLGYRATGSWNPSAVPDIISSARGMLARLTDALKKVPPEIRTAVVLPTLPLPPLFHTSPWQMAGTELTLERGINDFAGSLLERGIVLGNRQKLSEVSPPGERFDLKADALTGLPYTLPHADAVGSALAQLLVPPAPKKGLITDLDNTLWDGTVGEDGPEQVSWSLESHQLLYGLYQKLLSSLAEQGVLVGVASKNDPAIAAKALEREDLLISSKQLFPVEVNWNAKSASVAHILRAWKVSADSVVFVDDSPAELAEVAAVHPGIECVQFPKGDYAAGYQMLRNLRDLFAKERIFEEDKLRSESLRRTTELQNDAQSYSTPQEFLRHLNAVITFDFRRHAENGRALELVNKTNQFNLNGIRYTETDWQTRLSRPDALLAVVSYEDKFGSLGKIAVLQGNREGQRLNLGTWVMSCRAFARQIEYQCLQILFQQGIEEILFQFAPSPRNGPLRDFFASILGYNPDSAFAVTRTVFEERCPPLYHRVKTAAEKSFKSHGSD